MLFTIANNDERLSTYNSISGIVPKTMESNIKNICTDSVVKEYQKKLKCPKVIYECTKLTVYGTEYKPEQFGSSLSLPCNYPSNILILFK